MILHFCLGKCHMFLIDYYIYMCVCVCVIYICETVYLCLFLNILYYSVNLFVLAPVSYSLNYISFKISLTLWNDNLFFRNFLILFVCFVLFS